MTFPTPAARNNSEQASDVTSHVVALPDGIATGDRVLVIFVCDNGPLITWPSGWSGILANGDIASANALYDCRYKDIDGTEGFDGTGDTITITTDSAEVSEHRTWRWDEETFIANPDLEIAAGTSSTPDPPSLSPNWALEDTLWIAIACTANGARLATAYPANYTQAQFTDAVGGSTTGVALSTAERENAVATENPGTFSFAESVGWVCLTIAMQPATPPEGRIMYRRTF